MSSPFGDQPGSNASSEHGACAMRRVETFSGPKHMVEENSEADGVDLLSKVGGLSYETYLRLDKILDAQERQSEKNGKPVHDEHLFIVIHQTYELWFKQILFEIDSVREIFAGSERSQLAEECMAQTPCEEKSSELSRSRADLALPDSPVDESKMLEIICRMNRVIKILQIMVDQVAILETMTPLSFMDFRNYLGASSGFQSLQFRLLENKLGIKSENRVKYNQSNYRNVFNDSPSQSAKLENSETEPSLSECLQKWLERTPGLEPEGFNFPAKFQRAVEKLFEAEREAIAKDENPTIREYKAAQLNKKRDHFDSLLNEEIHNKLMARGERRFTLKALQGALMISLYSEEPRFHQPHHLLMLLMDLDALITKWRYNHVLLVQRMLGSQQTGSGGSSGYQYLRSTLSERYKIFLDLFNMASFLIPREQIPPLTPDMKTMLRTHSYDGSE